MEEVELSELKEEQLNFQQVLFSQLIRLSQLGTSDLKNDLEKFNSYAYGISTLEDLVYPYVDQHYLDEVQGLRKCAEDSSVEEKLEVLRQKLRCLLKLLSRKGLLLEETATMELK